MPANFLQKIFLLSIASGMMFLSGCFVNPTSPPLWDDHGGGLFSPTPTPTTSGGSGTITGTISGSAGGTVYIYATDVQDATHVFSSQCSGNGPYTISSIPDGSYDVQAQELLLSGDYPQEVQITNGNTVSGIDITLH